MRRLFFELRYLLGNAPWDTGISPPELLEFLQDANPGRALDLGCGTGTNAITIAKHGWQVVGVDFSALAIWAARRKARRQGLEIRFLSRDVTDLDDLAGPFDLTLDIGCLHGLDPEHRPKYARAVRRLAKSSGYYLLYSFIAQASDPAAYWPTEPDIKSLFEGDFDLASERYGRDRGRTSAWFKFHRRAS
jgi:cyclopropane fatty-acyl-phospholipid synthase-like methyltransferase